ncbi:MAG: restriction endonuclease subunit S [Geobacteraceae bacterium]|nr:restriction endonuclease subunit S [Geobacteraceae bacterium]
MAEWKRSKIGELCDIIKGETGLASSPPGQYPLVATGKERRTCATWQFDTDAVCVPLVSSTGHGKKSLNYVHYQSGKFALGTILAAIIPKDASILTARFLHLYLSHFKDTVLVPLMKGAANVSLPMKEIASIEIPVPPLDEQQNLINLIFRIEDEHRELLAETNRQGDLLKQLRQTVLQDAVEGKLTTEWRRHHPVVKGNPQHDAVALLAQIRAEKERLAKEGKIRKEKPLQPITDDDKSFDLPDGWIWCRLPQLLAFQDALRRGPFGSSITKDMFVPQSDLTTKVYEQKNAIYKNWSIGNYYIDLHNNSHLTNFLAYPGDIIISCAGTIGETYLLPNDAPVGVINQALLKVRLNSNAVDSYYFLKTFSALTKSRINSDAKGTAMKNIGSVDYLKNELIFPLPPLAEQKATVARVDSLMAVIEELEEQVAERKTQAQQLMQTVLREAFNPEEVIHSVK